MHETLSSQQLGAYLERIGQIEPLRADEESLFELHRGQFFSIPFENFDIMLGRGVDCGDDAVYRKLVVNRRGGYCFELNGLMLRVLLTLGFEARPVLARVHLTGSPSGLTHQFNLVRLGGGSWVVDVGFGAGGPRVPLRLREGVSECGRHSYELRRVNPWGWMLRTLEAGTWKDSYSFDRSHATAADIEVGNHYTSTSPKSHFTQFCTASLPTPDGRVSLRGAVLTEVTGPDEKSRTIDRDAYLDLVKDVFGIDLPAMPPLTAP